VEPGLYVTFFKTGEPIDGELPPVGPLEHVVVRDGALLADRKDSHGADHFHDGGGSIEAEYEFQRAVGNEPGGPRRRNLRIVAPQGVYLRFVSFGSAAEHDPVPELGPYAVVVIDTHAVEADGDRLASRIGTKEHLWELTGSGGTAFVGVIRPDIAFRTRSTLYHPQLKPFRPARTVTAAAQTAKPHPPAADKPRHDKVERNHEPAPGLPSKPEPSAAPPAKRVTAAQVADVTTITLRDRIRAGESARPESKVASARATGREWAGALWQLRFAIIAALVLLLVAFSVPSIRDLLTSGTSAGPISTVGVGTSLASPDWNYTVGSVRRVARIGSAQARGIFLVVQVAATNRKSAGAQLLPSAFALATANGEEYSASAATSGVYSGDANLSSSYMWPTEFPSGRSVVVPVIFEVSASVTGTQLVILDVPSTRVRLE
jgi:hypothetical protein